MMKAKNLLTGMLAVLAVLLLTGCWEKDNPSRTSLDVDTSTLTLSVGETAVRMATSKAEDAAITYTSSNPAVATVDQFGKVTALTEGETTITIDMAETKKSWYAAKTLTYSVVVKNVSAKALVNVDKATPLTLVAQADGKITVTFNNGITLANDIKYTINGGAEQTIAKNTSGAYDITVKKGDVVQLYSLNTSLGGSAVAGARGTTRAVDSGAKYINIRPSMKTEIYGNVMSLLKGKDNLESATTIEANNAFYGLFAGAEKLVNNTERLLVLPATTLTEGCYDNMFSGCKGIEKAPELPAPKLEKGCYQEMFYDCAKLNSVKCLATDIKAENSTKDWLGKAGTEATGTKTLESIVPMKADSDDGVPESWTPKPIVLVTSVTLGKTELALVINEADVTLTATVKPDDATDKTVTWTSSNPAVATVDETGKVHAVAAGTATITAQAGDKTATCKVTVTAPQEEQGTYRKYSYTTSLNYEDLSIPSDAKVMTSSTTSWNGTYKVDGNVTINGDIKCTGNVDLILLDGSKLTVNGHIYGGTNSESVEYSLNIYAQSEGSNMGALYFYPSNNGDAIYVKNLAIHGGKIVAEATNGDDALKGTIKIYGGDISATGYRGIFVMEGLDIHGGKVDVTGSWSGVVLYGGDMTITGGNVTAKATGQWGYGGEGLSAEGRTIYISGGTVTAIGTNGSNGGTNSDGAGTSGYSGGDGVKGSVVITGGTLTATGGNGGNGGNATGDNQNGGDGGNGGNGIRGQVTGSGAASAINSATGGKGGTGGTAKGDGTPGGNGVDGVNHVNSNVE